MSWRLSKFLEICLYYLFLFSLLLVELGIWDCFRQNSAVCCFPATPWLGWSLLLLYLVQFLLLEKAFNLKFFIFFILKGVVVIWSSVPIFPIVILRLIIKHTENSSTILQLFIDPMFSFCILIVRFGCILSLPVQPIFVFSNLFWFYLFISMYHPGSYTIVLSPLLS